MDRARRELPDMADDGWQRMLCIETANVWDDVVELAPGRAIRWASASPVKALKPSRGPGPSSLTGGLPVQIKDPSSTTLTFPHPAHTPHRPGHC
jgi:hypothetical protein